LNSEFGKGKMECGMGQKLKANKNSRLKAQGSKEKISHRPTQTHTDREAGRLGKDRRYEGGKVECRRNSI
jgi:hypothetical protein